MTTFIKSLPLFFSLILYEFLVFFFIYFIFATDRVTILFLWQYPLIIRLPLLVAFTASLACIFLTKEHKYMFLAICMNLALLFVLFEFLLFKNQSLFYSFVMDSIDGVKYFFNSVF